MSSLAPAVRIERLTKSYAGDWRGRTQRALDSVTLHVARGTICALVGANGSGKSTTLKICAGLAHATSGSCEVDGRKPAVAAREGRVAYLPEETILPDFVAASEFLASLAMIGGCSRREAREAAARALAQVGLSALAERAAAQLSKGQRQRLGLAQALLRDPAVLLLDEPTSGLDVRAQVEVRSLLVAQRAAGRTVVLSSHDAPHLEELCDRFVVLERGRLVFEGDRAAVAARGGLEQIQLEASEA
ncbi:MAG: ABC transporter ATP-binding protein [Candidatus Didemnitutus sp.]|nr:ABC transporter ATP-binding protein [Candidatus Didemnitutus sp.]